MYSVPSVILYLLIFFCLLLGINLMLLWPTSRKLLEYENINLRKENEQNHLLIHQLQGNIKQMADSRDKAKKDIEELQQIITILAKAQGIDDWRSMLKK